VNRQIIAGILVFAALVGTLVVWYSTLTRRIEGMGWTIALLSLLVGWLMGWSMSQRFASLRQPPQIPEGNLLEPRLVEDRGTKEIGQAASQFFRHLVHELKQPVASLQQSIYLLFDEVQGPLTVEQRRILEIQLRSANRVSNCIENLGDLFRLEGGAADYQLEAQDLVSLIEELVRGFEFRSRERRVEIKVDFSARPLFIECDRIPISRAIGHVIENAIKFSPLGGTIKIRAEYVLQIPLQSPQISTQQMSESGSGRGFIVVTIADSGPGIPESRREAIFEKFYQIKENGETYQQGLGIGLTICRSIVKAHHGTVWVEDNPAGGSLFSLLLPIATNADTMAYRVRGVS
jgi:signal transduction histidine kinase